MRKKLEEDKITNEKASVIIGQEYYNKYVNIKENK